MLQICRRAGVKLKMVMKTWKNGLGKQTGCCSVAMTTFRQKKTTAAEEDGGNKKELYSKEDLGMGELTVIQKLSVSQQCCTAANQATYWDVGGG